LTGRELLLVSSIASEGGGDSTSSSPSVTLSTRSIISLAVILGNAFWPAAEGMLPTIGSSNNAKTVSRFIDIIYSLSSKNALGNINSYEGYL
jgi:hypothetical protein